MSKSREAVKPIYPYTEWEIIETEFTAENGYRNETIFALGNGTIGLRGTFEEGYTGTSLRGSDGTYLNGFYESEPINYPEIAYGFPEKSQTMLNITNGKRISLYLADEEFSLFSGQVLDYRRVLDLRTGILRRTLVWRSPAGREASIEIKRLVSFEHKHLCAISYEVTPLNFSGTIKLVSILDGDVSNLSKGDDPRVGSGLTGRVLHIEDKVVDTSFAAIRSRTRHTDLVLVSAMENRMATECQYAVQSDVTEHAVNATFTIDAVQGQSIQLIKNIAYVSSQEFEESALLQQARTVVEQAAALGFAKLEVEQFEFLIEFWASADIVVEGDLPIQQGLRFNLFHLLQSVGRDGRTNIAAKGLTGEGYEGHYFWDTEIYVVPFFLHNHPDISRSLLEYRYSILDKARERARQMAQPKGALFPWRTINGEECSSYFPAGTAQVHINADIAYTIKRYMQVTDDDAFMINFGAEILFETARFWAGYGDFIPQKGGKFCINEVTGPDEYSALVNNNCYTNLMAQENLEYACEIARWMADKAPEAYATLAARIALEPQELDFWKTAAAEMYIPRDDALGIYLQDDGFLDKTPWDFENTPAENYPLLLHYHPMVIYRHQVCKQADLVLALYLLGHRFTQDEKKRNYDFYEKLTTHDSSLSQCIFSIVASEVGYHEQAYRYFMNTVRMDLDDYTGNVKDGVHIANMGGAWLCIVNGFAGMRTDGKTLSLNPYLPGGWNGYAFKLAYKKRSIKVHVDRTQVTYELLSGDDLSIMHHGEDLLLKTGSRVTRPIQ